jgi:SAM-dependent methyltransferase
MTTTFKEHWNKVYLSNPEDQLGWYETVPQVSLDLINNCGLTKNDPILDVGSGVTLLIDHLISLNYTNLFALDISEVALEKMRSRLGRENTSHVQMLVDDITTPAAVLNLKDMALWHDRALLHFLTEIQQQQTYRSVLEKVLRPGGCVIIASFAKDGAEKCSGLDVHRHDETSLDNLLGEEFELKESLRYRYQMPSGAIRPYIYARFQRIDHMEGRSLK